MTREDAIEIFEQKGWWIAQKETFTSKQAEEIIKLNDAVNFALSALRPVSREQVEKGRWIFRPYEKMPWCTQAICSECGSVVENNSSLSQESGIKLFVESNPFCRRCGAPMTDEAVEIALRRLEALKDGKGD